MANDLNTLAGLRAEAEQLRIVAMALRADWIDAQLAAGIHPAGSVEAAIAEARARGFALVLRETDARQYAATRAADAMANPQGGTA